MRSSLATLERIRLLYRAVSRTHELALQDAAGRVNEAERRLREEAATMELLRQKSAIALSEGDGVEWLLYRTERRIVAQSIEAIGAQLDQCEAESRAAAGTHRLHQMSFEQVDGVVRNAQARHAIEREREEQRRSDDRFLSRRRWVERRDARRSRC